MDGVVVAEVGVVEAGEAVAVHAQVAERLAEGAADVMGRAVAEIGQIGGNGGVVAAAEAGGVVVELFEQGPGGMGNAHNRTPIVGQRNTGTGARFDQGGFVDPVLILAAVQGEGKNGPLRILLPIPHSKLLFLSCRKRNHSEPIIPDHCPPAQDIAFYRAFY